MESRKVKIGITAKQWDGDEAYAAEPNVMNVICEAVLSENGDEFCVEYEEYITEDGGVTQTKLVFSKSAPLVISMIRTGEVNTAFSFSKGERCVCVYQMQGGLSLDFCMATKTVKNTLSLSGGVLDINYNIEVRGMVMSRNEYKLAVIKR